MCTWCLYNYPAIPSIGRDTKFAATFSFILYGYGFLSRGFTDRREILHNVSATSQTGLLPCWGDSPRDGRVLTVNRGHMAGYAVCSSTCLFCVVLFAYFKFCATF